MAEPSPPQRERGAALLTVLLLVAVMSVVTATLLEKLTIATRLTGNAAALDQARAYTISAEALAAARIGDLVAADPDRTTLAGGWNDTPVPLPIPGGSGTARVTDGGNCFNLNSLVSGDDQASLTVRPGGITQFRGLMEVLGIGSNAAVVIAASTADWIDTDDKTQPNGAEDDTYARAAISYRTANHWMAAPSELRAVQGVTPAIYATLRPWICALPTSDLSPINVNTLLPAQAPLLAMLAPEQLSIGEAQRAIAARPLGGYDSTDDFWSSGALEGAGVSPTDRAQIGVRTQWFAVETRVALGGVVSHETALFDAREAPVRLVRRQWGESS
jgi:general secretion pathway protein K